MTDNHIVEPLNKSHHPQNIPLKNEKKIHPGSGGSAEGRSPPHPSPDPPLWHSHTAKGYNKNTVGLIGKSFHVTNIVSVLLVCGTIRFMLWNLLNVIARAL